jgi:uncharacterized protein
MRGHADHRDWLTSVVNGQAAYGMSEFILSSFVRTLTNPKAFNVPTELDEAIGAAERLRDRPNCVPVSPGPMHWEIFARLCRQAEAKGNLITDAYLAALAIEVGAEWITTDRDFSRFPGLRWRHPLS